LDTFAAAKSIYLDDDYVGASRILTPPVGQPAWSAFDIVELARSDDASPSQKAWVIAKSGASYIAGPTGATVVESAKLVSDHPKVLGPIAVANPLALLSGVAAYEGVKYLSALVLDWKPRLDRAAIVTMILRQINTPAL